jgi:hypothetical protein
MNLLNINEVVELDIEPKNDSDYDTWIQQEEVVPFLEREGTDEDIIIYAGSRHLFIHAIFIPAFDVTSDSVAPLLDWDFNASDGWSITSSGSGDDLAIEQPLAHERSHLIRAGEQIIFWRGFEGVRHKSSYFELSQKIAHVLGLHHLEERNAWCTLNRFGDIDDIVKVHKITDHPEDRCDIITMRKMQLAEYAAIGKYVLLRIFVFHRYRSSGLHVPYGPPVSRPLTSRGTVFGNLAIYGASGSCSRGVQILDLANPKLKYLENIFNGDDTEKQYVTFIAHDWRHGKLGEFSCDPKQLANYFVPSPYPYETTPAFFRPEVLSKYKADTEKYSLEDRSVSCRGAWHLRGIGVNDAGQVHAYLFYLGNLPYEEQLHWKQYNEAPKAGLSKSVITTDFNGQFSDEYDPLPELKHKLQGVEKRQVGWWTVRDATLLKRTHYPFSDSRDDWASELMNLDQLLVEGLIEKWLRKKAMDLGRNPDDRLRPLKLLEECLCGLGFEETHARKLLTPWHTLHNLRSELKAHPSHSKGLSHEIEARKEYGNLKNHFRQLCQECDESLQIIITALEESPPP